MINNLKRQVVKMAFQGGEAHIPSALSILDIVWIMYDQILQVNPKKPAKEDRDKFFLSKGHASLALYVVLAEKGFFDKKHLDTYLSYESILGGHPDRNKVPGVEASTGSLGHGMPIAVGAALANKIFKRKSRVYVLIGDGEANEGTIWESAMLASHRKLNNLTCIVDYNHSSDRALVVDSLRDKFTSFGWEVVSINGHNHEEIKKSLKRDRTNKPLAIIAKTIKGSGLKEIENNPAWHHRAPTKKEYQDFLNQLK